MSGTRETCTGLKAMEREMRSGPTRVGHGMDHANMVRQTSDGGYILIDSQSDEFPNSDVCQGDIALIKTDAESNKVWSRNYDEEILYLGWGGRSNT